MKVTITNKGTGPQVVHSSSGKPVNLAVGQSREVDMHENIVKRMENSIKRKRSTLRISRGAAVEEQQGQDGGQKQDGGGDGDDKQLSVAQTSALELIKEAGGIEYNDFLQQAKAILPDDAFGGKPRPKKDEIIDALQKLANPEQE